MSRALSLLTNPTPSRARSAELESELQTYGMRWLDPRGPGLSRSGGAGPSDHKAVRLDGQTLMVPIFTHASTHSPFSARVGADGNTATLLRHGRAIATLSFPGMPRFYARSTADGVPYWKIATLHGSDVLATTVLQTCVRYGNRESACQFCAIGQSLAKKNTVAEKTPEQLAEVARAAVELDHVQHAVLTTGTPHTDDRGAAVLSAAARAIKAAVALPIQAQCEPPADFAWFAKMRESGVNSLGLHLEAVSERVRKRIMPGKAEVPVETYYRAFSQAVRVFGRAQVSTYILAGLGDSREEIADACQRLLELGVYPFVVPFVPLSGTPLESHPAPSPAFLDEVLSDVARLIARHGMRSSDVRAGCARCGACSSLRAREVYHA